MRHIVRRKRLSVRRTDGRPGPRLAAHELEIGGIAHVQNTQPVPMSRLVRDAFLERFVSRESTSRLKGSPGENQPRIAGSSLKPSGPRRSSWDLACHCGASPQERSRSSRSTAGNQSGLRPSERVPILPTAERIEKKAAILPAGGTLPGAGAAKRPRVGATDAKQPGWVRGGAHGSQVR